MTHPTSTLPQHVGSAEIAAYESQRDEAIALLHKIGIRWAVRGGARGPNNRLRRGRWTVDGHPATAAQARQLNGLRLASGYGVRVLETAEGLWTE